MRWAERFCEFGIQCLGFALLAWIFGPLDIERLWAWAAASIIAAAACAVTVLAWRGWKARA